MKTKRLISILLIITISVISVYSVSAKDTTTPKYGVSLLTPNKITLGLGEKYLVQSKSYDKGSHSNFYDVVPEGDNSVITKMSINKNISYCLIKSNSVGDGDYYWTYSSKYYKKPKFSFGEPCNPKYATEFCVDVKNAPSKVYLNKTSIVLKKGKNYVLSEKTNTHSYANPQNIKWSSSNSRIAKVTKTPNSNKATIKALNKGICYITVKTYNNKMAKCKVFVM